VGKRSYSFQTRFQFPRAENRHEVQEEDRRRHERLRGKSLGVETNGVERNRPIKIFTAKEKRERETKRKDQEEVWGRERRIY